MGLWLAVEAGERWRLRVGGVSRVGCDEGG